MEKIGIIKIGTEEIRFLANDSRRLVKVDNEYSVSLLSQVAHLWIQDKSSRLRYLVNDGMRCKAKIKKNKVLIIETLQEYRPPKSIRITQSLWENQKIKELQITAYRITPNCRKEDGTGATAILTIMDDMVEKIQKTLSVEENKEKTIRVIMTLLDKEDE